MKHFLSQAGVSLLEVLFATAAVSLVLVAVLSTIISSLQNSRSSLDQAKATHYSREVLEWLRQERDSVGWTAFAESMPGTGTQTYCVTALPNGLSALSGMQGTCGQEDRISNTIYTREVSITRTSVSQVDIEVAVSRPDSTGVVTSKTNLTLSEWQ
jgi:Tfp pilus assembly protein PilV